MTFSPLHVSHVPFSSLLPQKLILFISFLWVQQMIRYAHRIDHRIREGQRSINHYRFPSIPRIQQRLTVPNRQRHVANILMYNNVLSWNILLWIATSIVQTQMWKNSWSKKHILCNHMSSKIDVFMDFLSKLWDIKHFYRFFHSSNCI